RLLPRGQEGVALGERAGVLRLGALVAIERLLELGARLGDRSGRAEDRRRRLGALDRAHELADLDRLFAVRETAQVARARRAERGERIGALAEALAHQLVGQLLELRIQVRVGLRDRRERFVPGVLELQRDVARLRELRL